MKVGKKEAFGNLGIISTVNNKHTECLETEKMLFPRKIIESAYIKANRNRCMNLNERLLVTTVYGKGKEGWLGGKGKVYTQRTTSCALQ